MPPCRWPFAIYIHVYMCMCACACMCMCVGTPPHASRHPPTHLTPPQSHREPKTAKFNKSWPNRDNSILFEDSLPLNIHELLLTHIIPDTPHPPAPPLRAEEIQIRRITIILEWIEIIQYRLKICDPWTLLHTYRLGLMCRCGGVLSQMALLCFGPKKVLLWPLNKKISYFALDSIRPHLDWDLRGFLTS